MYQKLFLSLLPALVAAGPGLNPNPDPNFDPAISKGTFGPFVIPQAPSAAAIGGPPKGSIDARTLQAMQLAASNWATDTGIVSLFQNQGPVTTDDAQFKGIADGAFKAEVDELTQKAVLDQVIGNDPRVSLANLTLTNGVFQSVVDNLQIMSIQGQQKVNLVDAINQVRCTQILPSIDTYMIVAAEYIGDNAQQRRAVRPNACAQILAGADASMFAALPVRVSHCSRMKRSTNFPFQGTPGGVPVGTGDGNVAGIPGACGQGNMLPTATDGTSNTGSPTDGSSNIGSPSDGTSNNGGPSDGTGSATATGPLPLASTTTPQLGLPGFPGGSLSDPSAAASSSTPGVGTGKTGKGKTGSGKTGSKPEKESKSPYSGRYSYGGRYGNFTLPKGR
jgi:hypothetical protein